MNPLINSNGDPLIHDGAPRIKGTRQWVENLVESGTASNVRQRCSVASISDNLAVSFVRNPSAGDSELRYAELVAGAWQYHSVDTAAVITDTSLVELGNGCPAIAYRTSDSGTSTINLAEYDGLAWTITVIDSVSSPDDITVTDNDRFAANINGEAAVVYRKYDDSSGGSDLLYDRLGVSSTIVSGTGAGDDYRDVRSVYQIGLDAAVAYIDINDDLLYADKTSGWVTQFIENLGGIGTSDASLHEIDNQPAIAYYRSSPQGPKYARFDGAVWDIENIMALSNNGQDISLTEYQEDAAVIFTGNLNNPARVVIRDGTWGAVENFAGFQDVSITTVQGVLCTAQRDSQDITTFCLFEGCCCDWPF